MGHERLALQNLSSKFRSLKGYLLSFDKTFIRLKKALLLKAKKTLVFFVKLYIVHYCIDEGFNLLNIYICVWYQTLLQEFFLIIMDIQPSPFSKDLRRHNGRV